MADPNDPLTWFVQAEILENQGRHEEAIVCYDKGLALGPDSPDAWLAWNSRGIQLAKFGKWKDAIASFDQAIAIDPRRSEAWFNKGESLAEGLSDYTAAFDCLEEAIKLGNAQAGKSIARLGDVLLRPGLRSARAGRWEEAIQSFSRAIEINPRLAHAWNNKGAVLSEMGRYDEALECHQKAVDIDPSISQALFNIGVIFHRRQDAESALRYFDAAARLGNREAEQNAKTTRENSDLDRAIGEKLALALTQAGLDGVKCSVRMGAVTLMGEVDTQTQREQAGSIASSVLNVQRVVNEIVVRGEGKGE